MFITNQSHNGRPMAIGKVIFVDPPKPMDVEFGVGSHFIVHLGYCDNCKHRIALRMNDLEHLLAIGQIMTHKQAKHRLGANLASKIKNFIGSVRGEEFRENEGTD